MPKVYTPRANIMLHSAQAVIRPRVFHGWQFFNMISWLFMLVFEDLLFSTISWQSGGWIYCQPNTLLLVHTIQHCLILCVLAKQKTDKLSMYIVFNCSYIRNRNSADPYFSYRGKMSYIPDKNCNFAWQLQTSCLSISLPNCMDILI